MSKVIVDMGMSLDGFIAGSNGGPHNVLNEGGHRIHRWNYDLESERERHSLAGGQINQDDEVGKENFHLSKRTACE